MASLNQPVVPPTIATGPKTSSHVKRVAKMCSVLAHNSRASDGDDDGGTDGPWLWWWWCGGSPAAAGRSGWLWCAAAAAPSPLLLFRSRPKC